MSGNSTSGQIREQIGRIESKLDSLAARITEIKAEAKEAELATTVHRDRIWAELRTVKHEARNDISLVSLRLEKQERLLSGLQDTVDGMQGPLQFAVTLHRRLGAIGMLAASVGMVMWGMRDIIFQALTAIMRLFLPGRI